ncbi:FadR/GntR family transcriptional regulator [Agromyces sp. NBRC 114283]|uniref:FadR/GntR family transcriptional regulator n=1 Tax=Agromyces sp. NBRC 114283 TaxID=2994521 RepID=UPI0024A355C7|nr:FadR/GntR family transcriptional regulator [Agromyces sp. NBRC 114283]GLU88232.1 transcriptional regulator [Agromyces sp. NBRC 114283]
MDWTEIEQGRTLSVPDRLSIRLERLILDGTLQPGEKLPPELELTERLGVSRVSLRQALHELERRGLIDRKPGRGTVVLSPADARDASGAALAEVLGSTGGEIAHILELRSIIEPRIAALASQRATPRDLVQLEQLVDEMASPESKEHYAELDRAFHQAIAQYTHNPLLAMLNEQIANLIAPSRSTALQTQERRDTSTAAHRRILAAIASGEPEVAEHEAALHIGAVREQIEHAAAALAAGRTGDEAD